MGQIRLGTAPDSWGVWLPDDPGQCPGTGPVRLGAMCEPPLGVLDMEPLVAALEGLDADLFAIVEQDLYPCEPDVPLPIATRTRQYFNRCGLGPLPRTV